MSQLEININAKPSGTGCVECEQTAGWWFHLRRCTACGHIGCCDSSLSKHATAHAHATGHPIITSFEPAENWFFDYRTNTMIDGPPLADPDCHPLDQTTPGPAARVPIDWEEQLSAQA
jgi:hypothetical protein